ncbi:SRPBCC family protein [Paraglaciecola aquimarina]|uniref:SRPBCC family protein n=1 Tax=Paraglaciecola aquimarina TaxID=1235557 RepID=A0ABU3SU98_9ALTE|nr:SRPBCC family protein [Paraglaciecola aquimarina]MDU0353596.1 SRPBCC family protein [Paraglaciecola aquimarina]
MPKIHVLKTITIQAPIDKVYARLNDFNYWAEWSPWLIMEPEAKVNVTAEGKHYQWAGDRVGEGNMQVLSEQHNKKIDYALNFLKPWKSKAEVSFVLSEKNDAVEVSWSMESKLPFFLFWMKKMMIAYIGMDYQRGLNMLKEVIETGVVSSRLEFIGESYSSPCHYIGLKTSCSQAEISHAMQRDFAKLQDVIQNLDHRPIAQPFSIYHKWDMVKKSVDYTVGIPLAQIPATIPMGFVAASIPATQVYTIRHIGKYEHLGNAWSTLYTMQQNNEINCNKKIHPFEVYVNDPATTQPTDLITDIHFPLK